MHEQFTILQTVVFYKKWPAHPTSNFDVTSELLENYTAVILMWSHLHSDVFLWFPSCLSIAFFPVPH